MGAKEEFGDEDEPEDPADNGQCADERLLGCHQLSEDDEQKEQSEYAHRFVERLRERLGPGQFRLTHRGVVDNVHRLLTTAFIAEASP